MNDRVRTSSLRLVLVSMTLANAMILVDQTAVPLILPDVMQTFGVGSETVQWELNASLLPLAGLLVLGGRLGDLLAGAGSSSSAPHCSAAPPRWPGWHRCSPSCSRRGWRRASAAP